MTIAIVVVTASSVAIGVPLAILAVGVIVAAMIVRHVLGGSGRVDRAHATSA